jgi:hypothetical protein
MYLLCRFRVDVELPIAGPIAGPTAVVAKTDPNENADPKYEDGGNVA